MKKTIVERQSKKAKIAKILMGAAMIALPTIALASGNDLNKVGENFIQLAQTGKMLLLAFFYLGGLGLAGYGAWTIYKALKPNSQENFGLGAGMFVVGVVLCILPSMIGLTANTAIGGDGEGQTKQAIESAPSFGGG